MSERLPVPAGEVCGPPLDRGGIGPGPVAGEAQVPSLSGGAQLSASRLRSRSVTTRFSVFGRCTMCFAFHCLIEAQS